MYLRSIIRIKFALRKRKQYVDTYALPSNRFSCRETCSEFFAMELRSLVLLALVSRQAIASAAADERSFSSCTFETIQTYCDNVKFAV